MREMNAELFSATILLILVIDPFGNVPLVVSALKNVAPERRVRVVLRECAAAYVILLAFMIGSWLIALTLAMGATTVVLALADRLQRWLGERAVLAFERLMGLVLTALAVEMLLSGVRTFAGEIGK